MLDSLIKQAKSAKFQVDPEFKALIPPLSNEEHALLTANVIEEGCRDPLVVWQETNVLLDGHNRFGICTEHGIEYRVTYLSMPDRQSAVNWIVDNQLGRRNLSPVQASVLRGKRYNAEKDDHGGDRKSNDHFDHLIQGPTAERLASEWGVSPGTVRRDARLAAEFDKYEPDVQQEIMQGKYTKQDVIAAQGDADVLRAPKPAPQPQPRRGLDVHFSSETPEHYTPKEIIAATLSIFGSIYLDPCSNSKTSPNVPATKHYTKEDDGLTQFWEGNVYMNPPYGRGIEDWVRKLVEAYESQDVEQAIALLPARPDTQWWQTLRNFPCCFITGRLKFIGNDDPAPFPSAVFYLGTDMQAFYEAFSSFGDIWTRIDEGWFTE